MALARLIADIEPVKREDVTFVFAHRFDCAFDQPTIDYVSQKFNVRTFRSSSRGTGWPQGPNDLFRDSYQFCIEEMRNGHMKGDGILFMEPDCIPLDMNWINHLIHEWKHCGKQILGCWLMEGDCGVTHINGNCIIHKDFWRNNREILNPKSGGWDSDCRHIMLPAGAPSRLIWSDYGLGKPGYNDWKGCDWLFATKRFRAVDNPLFGQDIRPVYLHGPKILDGIDCVRARFNLPPR
jgi:hypothetical protein